MRWQFLLFSCYLVKAHAELQQLQHCREEDVAPLLQLSRKNESLEPVVPLKNQTALGDSAHPFSAVAKRSNASLHRQSPILHALAKAPPVPRPRQNSSLPPSKLMKKTEEQLPFFGPTSFPLGEEEDPNADPAERRLTRRMKEKQLGREAVSAAALIMVLISFSVGLQLIMVEFVMTGTCAIPCNIAGMILAVILAVTAALRSFVRMILRPLRPLWLLFKSSCLYRRSKAPPLLTALPDHLLEEVVSFCDLEGMCGIGTASRKSKDLSNSERCYGSLMEEVAQNSLDARWHRHLQSYKEKRETRPRPVSVKMEVDSDTESLPSPQDQAFEPPTALRTPVPSSPEVPNRQVPRIRGFPFRPAEQTQVPQHIIQELRSFLCKQMRRSAAKAQRDEVNERWIVITDVVRYCMLVVGWFWFSAEVMDMACLEGGGPWQVTKAVTSPCLFIFILESDRSQFWWQVLAGLVATAFLLDLLFA